ncbi:PREDICTED: ATP-binding cassette sub-family G member 5-like [Priapulus caudatus]|uniref:ATP-binding cassette sub-family G member 5-like n=1 Tax=Priapulus caudatus TaxID=37621 RepID=A0ABM1EQI3_PRICU|nr:PREDICTED: ATP-binding cassette sub-family G member 5-like [Priapulus caudatus]
MYWWQQGCTGGNRGELVVAGVYWWQQRNNGAYVSYATKLMPLLTVKETLHYTTDLYYSRRMPRKRKHEKVRCAVTELDLVLIEDDLIRNVTESERRKVVIGLQLLRDPLVVLVEEPMTGMDSFGANAIVALLSRFAKKYSRIVLFTAHRPQSDIYPMVDKVAYLCSGEVVYTGYTKSMLEYYHKIGCPCPEFENPLDFFLTMASLDRRTPARLLETTTNVDKLKVKFEQYETLHQPYYGDRRDEFNRIDVYQSRRPMSSWGQPGFVSKIFTLTRRATWHLCRDWRHLSVRLLQLPLFAILLFLFVWRLQENQAGIQTRLGVLFYSFAGTSFLSCLTTPFHFAFHRNIYHQEAREGIYGGHSFVLSQMLYTVLPNFAGVCGGAAIIYWASLMATDVAKYFMFALTIWCVYSYAEVQTIAVMWFVGDPFVAMEISSFMSIVSLVAGSGFLRPINSLPDYVYVPTFATIHRYAGYVVADNEFTDMGNDTCDNEDYRGDLCRYTSGRDVMSKLWPENNGISFSSFQIMFILYGVLCVIAVVLHATPWRRKSS